MGEKTYQINFSWDEEVLKVSINGQASTHNADEIAQNVIKICGEHRPDKVLIDCTKLSGRLNIIQTYYHVKQYPLDRYNPARSAVLESRENEPFYSFHETAAANVGAHIKYFIDIDDAMRWLRQ